MGIKGYKVFNPDWTCRDFQYEVGKTFFHDGNIEICDSGFHFCQNPADCFNYYNFDSSNKVAEVEATGLVETSGDKSVTNEIRIVREIEWQELLTLVNTGKNCTGWHNSGDFNSGSHNSGDFNSGDFNSGDFNSGWHNSGWHNSGWHNSGWHNSGDFNSGSHNSGDFNSGSHNSGDFNSGDWNNGFFNTIAPQMIVFNKPLDVSRDEFKGSNGIQILSQKYENGWWISSKNMTDEEKEAHPEHETTGGYLKTVSFKEACKIMWSNLTPDEKEEVKKIPNFDADIFEEITGIKV